MSPRPAAAAEEGDRRSIVQSVDRAFDVLRVLQNESGAITVQEIALRADLDRTVVHRLLKTLALRSMVIEERGSFRLGPESVLLANRYIDSLLVRRLSVPYLVELQAQDIADEPWTANLSIPVGDLVTVVERIWTPTTPLDLVLTAGDSFPIHAAAAGRAILAYYSRDAVRRLVGKERHLALEPSFKESRAAGGVGLSKREAVPGVEALAAVILSRREVPIAAIAVSGVDLRDQLDYDSLLAQKLRRAAYAIGQMIP